MSHSVAARFELVLLHDFSTTDARQVPFAGAVVLFYGQGATVSNADPIPATSTIDVFDTGDLFVGASVMAGIGGPTLTVTAINSSTQITISGASSGLILPPGTRLILTSNRPEVFSDPRGTISLGNSLTADSRGRVTGYIRNPRFDYVVEGETVVATYDASSSASISGGYTTSWTHATSANVDRIMFLAISWTGTSGGEAIESVTYNGIPLFPVGNANFTDVYLLLNPPSGSHTVVVSFQNTDVVNAVVGAVTMFGWNTQSAFVMQSTGAGSGTSASTVLGSTASSSLLLAFLGIGNQTSFATVTTAQTTMWNNTVGTASPYRTNGAAERTAGTGGNVTMSFSWSGSRQWGILAVELKAATARLFADGSASVFPVPDWLSAQSFPSLKDAVDALPDSGGTVYLTAATYLVSETIFIPEGKHVRLLGDGPMHSIIRCEDEDVDIVWIKSAYCTLENLAVQGPGIGGTGRGVVIGLLSDDSPTDIIRRPSLLNCLITDTSSYALYVYGQDDGDADDKTLSIWGHFERTDFTNNQTNGLVWLGQTCNVHKFLNCTFTAFNGLAFNVVLSNNVAFDTCTFEDKHTNTEPYVIVDGAKHVAFNSCWFESHAAIDTNEYFIRIGLNNACSNITVRDCQFVRNQAGLGLPMLIDVGHDSQSVTIHNVLGIVDAPTADRSATPDIRSSEGCSVQVIGGAVVAKDATANFLLVDATTQTPILGATPRVAVPLVTELQRDMTTGLDITRNRGNLIYNSDAGRLQAWSGSDWLPFTYRIENNSSGSGTLLSTPGTYRISASASITSATTGTVTVAVTWTTATATRTQTIIDSFGTAGGLTNGSCFVDATDATSVISYLINTTGFLSGSFVVVIAPEAV